MKATTITLQKIRNSFFGGNIKCAGLLVIDDIEEYIRDFREAFQVMILPSVMFDEFGRDLVGASYTELKNRYDIEIEVI